MTRGVLPGAAGSPLGPLPVPSVQAVALTLGGHAQLPAEGLAGHWPWGGGFADSS